MNCYGYLLLFQGMDLLLKIVVLIWFSVSVLVRISEGSSKFYVSIYVNTSDSVQQKLIQSCCQYMKLPKKNSRSVRLYSKRAK